MNQDDFHDDFLNILTDKKSNRNLSMPEWVSKTNSSYKAYHVVMELFETKKAYIKNHKRKANYKKKFTYQISKSEVAEKTGVAMQAIFHSVKYAGSLDNFLKDKNNELILMKEKVINKSYSGNKSKTKQQLVKSAQDANEKYKALAIQNAEKMLELALQKMPLNTKQKLGLL